MEKAITLYDIHQASGLTHEAVVEQMGKLGLPRHWSAVSKLFQRGTNKSDVIDALAEVYGGIRLPGGHIVDFATTRAAAKASHEQGIPECARRKKRTPEPKEV